MKSKTGKRRGRPPGPPRPKKKPKPRGGARPGAGRPRDRLPQEMVDRLGVVPTTPAELDTWVRRCLAELLVLQMTGKVSVDLAASVRATCGEIRRSMPAASAPAAADDDDDDAVPGAELEDDEDNDDPTLPQPKEAGGDVPLRLG